MRATILIMLVVAQLAMGRNYFYAKFTQTNDPNMPNGVVTGEIWNIWDSAASTNNRQITRYNSPAVVNELIHQGKQIRYRYCDNFGSCQAETYKIRVQPFHAGGGYSATSGTYTINGVSCTRYQKSAGADEVKYLYVGGGKVQRAVYGNGRTLDFTAQSTASFSKNFEPASSCPKPRCTKVINLVFNLDNSGSISSSEFKTLRSYVFSILDRFEIASDATAVGIVFFNTKAYDMVPGISSTYSSIKNAVNKGQKGGNTCAGSGIRKAISMIDATSSSRKARKPANIIITITDGNDYNCPTNNKASKVMSDLKSRATYIAVGVGNGISTSNLKKISKGEGYYFKSPNFNELKNKVDALVSTSCQDLPSINPCGSSCKGFCTCNKACVCPSCTPTFCTIYSCSSGANGCTAKTRNCNDNNVCTINDRCNEGQRKCLYDNLAMPASLANNKCLDKSCHKTNGWVSTPHICPSYTAQDPCNLTFCDPATGCYTRKKTNEECTDNNKCTDDTCVTGYGCVSTLKKNPNAAIVCVDHYCDLNDGVWKMNPWNIAERCTDNNKCTDDHCNNATGCYHTEHKCPDNGKPIDPCTMYKCNKQTGCYEQKITGCKLCATKNCVEEAKAKGEYSPCNVYECKEDATRAWCEVNPKDTDDGNPCTADTCDAVTGEVTHKEIDCTPRNKCESAKCNPSTGECEYAPIACESADPCMVGTCDEALGCIYQPLCPAENCKEVSCVVDGSTGHASCNTVDRECDDNNACTANSCNAEANECVYEPIVCTPPDLCHEVDHCDPVEGCVFKPIVCTAGPCGWAECVPDRGCVEHYPCNDGRWCTDDSCADIDITEDEYEQLYKDDPNFFNLREIPAEEHVVPEGEDGDEEDVPAEPVATHRITHCTFFEKREDPAKFGQCYEPVCSDEKQQFIRRVREDAIVDACGACAIEVGDNYDDTACFAGATNEEFASALGTVAIVGIIVAAIIGAAVVTISATAGTKELLSRSAAAQTTSVQNNPFYKENRNEMSNPTFEGNDGFNF